MAAPIEAPPLAAPDAACESDRQLRRSFGRAQRRRFLLLLAAVIVIKLIYIVQYSRLPFLRSPIYDSVVYLRQARAVLAGDFSDPTLLAFSPLYGYFLAACGGAGHPGYPILLQLVLGCVNLHLIYRLTLRRFGEAAALISASLYFGYGLILSYESKLLSDSLGLTLALAACALYLSSGFARGRWLVTIGCGAVAALAVLARASLLFTLPVLGAVAFLPWGSEAEDARTCRPSVRTRVLRTLGVALGMGSVLLCSGLWNRAHSGLFVPVILVSKTVEKTTSRGFHDDFGAFNQGPTGGANAFDVVNQAAERLARARQGIPEPASTGRPLWGVDVVGWLSGAPLKLAHTLSDAELTFDYGYFGERSEVAVLSWFPISFGILLCLGTVGAAMLIRRRGGWALVPYLPLFLGVLLTTTLFHSSSRYRLPLVLPLILLAGMGVVEVLRLPQRRVRALLCVALAGICLPLSYRTVTYRLHAPYTWELRVAQSAAVGGDARELSLRLARVAQLGPDDPQLWRRIEQLAQTGGVPVPPRPVRQGGSR